MLLKRLVPLTHLPPEGVRQLLRLLLLCQPAQHVLPAATGILWAVAQVRPPRLAGSASWLLAAAPAAVHAGTACADCCHHQIWALIHVSCTPKACPWGLSSSSWCRSEQCCCAGAGCFSGVCTPCLPQGDAPSHSSSVASPGRYSSQRRCHDHPACLRCSAAGRSCIGPADGSCSSCSDSHSRR